MRSRASRKTRVEYETNRGQRVRRLGAHDRERRRGCPSGSIGREHSSVAQNPSLKQRSAHSPHPRSPIALRLRGQSLRQEPSWHCVSLRCKPPPTSKATMLDESFSSPMSWVQSTGRNRDLAWRSVTSAARRNECRTTPRPIPPHTTGRQRRPGSQPCRTAPPALRDKPQRQQMRRRRWRPEQRHRPRRQILPRRNRV